MKQQDSLFSLIKSMSATEKAHFKKYAPLENKNKSDYFKLFQLYDKEDTFDNESFTFKTKRLGFKNPSAAKYKLYRVLLQTLVQYNKEKIEEYPVFERLLEAKMLQKRGMVEESLKELDAAEKLNEKMAVTEIYPYILIRKNYYSPYHPEYIDYKINALKLAEEKLHVLTDVVNYEQVSAGNIKYVLEIGTVCKTEEERAHFENILNTELFTTHEPRSTFGKMMKYHLTCFYSYLINDIERAYVAACKAISFVSEPLNKLDQGTLQNLSIFHYNAIQYALSTKNEKIFNHHYTNIATIHHQLTSPFYVKRVEGELKFLMLNWYLENKEYQKAYHAAEEILSLGDQFFEYNQSVLSEVYMKIALAFFYAEHYHQATDHINHIWQNTQIHALPEENTLLSLLEILCHLRLENLDLAKDKTRALYRRLKKQNRLFQFEQLIVRFINDWYHTPANKGAQSKLKEKYLDEIQELKQSQTESFFLELIDLESWIGAVVQ